MNKLMKSYFERENQRCPLLICSETEFNVKAKASTVRDKRHKTFNVLEKKYRKVNAPCAKPNLSIFFHLIISNVLQSLVHSRYAL